jgi:hypothetical protein
MKSYQHGSVFSGVPLPVALLHGGAAAHWAADTENADVNLNDITYAKKAWAVVVGSGYSHHTFVVFARGEEAALNAALDAAVDTAPGWVTEPGDKDLEEAIESGYDGESYYTDDGSSYLGPYDGLSLTRLDYNATLTALAAAGVPLDLE